MKYDIGAKVKIKSLNVGGTVKKVLPYDRYMVRVRRPLTNRVTGEPLLSYRSGRQSFTVETHNIAEIDMELHRSYNDGTANSDKGLTTLEKMDVDPESVAIVLIKYVKEIHNITANWACDSCQGTGNMRVPKDQAQEAGLTLLENRAYNNRVNDLQGNEIGQVSWSGIYTWHNTCPVKCTAGCTLMEHVRGRRFSTEAYAKRETRPTEVTVAYPQWTPGVIMDSRFRHGTSIHHQCQLCAKAIPSGHLVPVEGRDSQQKPHGLYIGVDCAKKFTGYNVELVALPGTTDIIVNVNEGDV